MIKDYLGMSKKQTVFLLTYIIRLDLLENIILQSIHPKNPSSDIFPLIMVLLLSPITRVTFLFNGQLKIIYLLKAY